MRTHEQAWLGGGAAHAELPTPRRAKLRRGHEVHSEGVGQAAEGIRGIFAGIYNTKKDLGMEWEAEGRAATQTTEPRG